LKNHVYAPLIDKGSKVIALVLFLGYAAIPLAVLLTANCGACCK
jgi:hypothetical protein